LTGVARTAIIRALAALFLVSRNNLLISNC